MKHNPDPGDTFLGPEPGKCGQAVQREHVFKRCTLDDGHDGGCVFLRFTLPRSEPAPRWS